MCVCACVCVCVCDQVNKPDLTIMTHSPSPFRDRSTERGARERNKRTKERKGLNQADHNNPVEVRQRGPVLIIDRAAPVLKKTSKTMHIHQCVLKGVLYGRY